MQVAFPRIDIFSLIILAGVVQGFFLSAIYLMKNTSRYRANIFIGLLFLSLSLCVLEIFLNYSGLIFKMLWLDNFSEPFIFLFGPLVFLYITALINMKQKHVWVHFVWFGFYALYHILYLIQSVDFKFDSVNAMYNYQFPNKEVQILHNPDPLSLRRFVNEILGMHWLGYLIFSSVLVIKKYSSKGLRFYSLNNNEFSWARNLLFHLWISFIIFVVVKTTFGRDLGDYLIATYMAASMYITTFYLVRNSIALKPLTENNEAPANTVKYQKSSLKESDKETIINKLGLLMREEKVFKNNLLSLNELSRKAGVQPHHLSQVINETTGKTFFEYLAVYRVEEAKQMLCVESENLTIEEIAEQVGYNSKSAFNKIFKKHTGATPSEYREKYKKQGARS